MLPLRSHVWKGANDPTAMTVSPPLPWSEPIGSLPPMESRLVWTDDENFTVDGVGYASMARQAPPDRLTIFKARPAIEQYEDLVRVTRPKTIFELGIFGGGSTALLAQLAAPTKLVAVEISEARIAVLDRFIERHDLGTVVSAYYGVNQADSSRLSEIVAHEFGGTPLDLVIDDASHLIDETRASFHALFPHLQPGGTYVVEDWSWPHRNYVFPDSGYQGVTPISAFALELGLVAACDDRVIADVTLRRGMAVIHRGTAALDPGAFDVASYLDPVGVEMVNALGSTRTLS
jgi:predicted O-methyltransferase YrrM